MERLSKTEIEINEVLKVNDWQECDVIPSALGSFTIACGEDLTYYHTLELTFNNVLITHCRYDFHIDPEKGMFVVNDPLNSPIRLADDVLASGYRLYTIRQDDGRIYCIASNELIVSYDTVLRYYKEDLQPGQRIASWVTKP